jgi:hypothetical protein
VYQGVKSRAEARKLDREGNVQLAESGVRVAQYKDDRVDKLQRDVEGLILRERQRDRLALAHERWDYKAVDELHKRGITLPPPPPLFLDPATEV